MNVRRCGIAVAWVAPMLAANIVQAFSITAVNLSPGRYLPRGVPLEMLVDIATPSQPAELYAPTTVSAKGNEIYIDIYPDAGPLTAVGSLREKVSLGAVPPGDYKFEVVIHPAFDVGWGTRTNRGAFTVSASPIVVAITAEDPQATELPPWVDAFDPIRFRIHRLGDLTLPTLVFLSVSGTATAGVDYEPLDSPVLLPAGVDSADLVLVPKWDEAKEGMETILVRLEPSLLMGPQPTYDIDPERDFAVGAIFDPPRTVVSIEAIARISEESSYPFKRIPLRGEFKISRTGPTIDPLPVFVTYSGLAEPIEDYLALPMMATIPAGSDATVLVVEPTMDDLPEGLETVVATVSNCPPPPSLAPCFDFDVDPANASATVFIRDDGLTEASVTITKPAQGASVRVGETILIEAVAVDLGGYLSRVVFFDGGKEIGVSEVVFVREPEPGSPIIHQFEWRGAPVGAHELTARALRADGQAVVSPPTRITVEGEPPPRTVVSIGTISPIAEEDCAPLERLPLRGQFKVSRTGATTHPLSVFMTYAGLARPTKDYVALPALATIPAGADSTVLVVEPVVDDLPEGLETLVATVSNCPPPPLATPCFDFEIAPAHASATVFIRDDGLTEASVTITRPASGASFRIGETILLEAVAIDLDGYLARVAFFDGDKQIGVSQIDFFREPDPGSPIFHQFEWRDAMAGPHEVTARAARATGELVDSAPVRILVGPGENRLPAVAIVRPASGTTFPPDTPIEIVVSTRDPDGYVPKVEFYADGQKLGESTVVFIRPPDPGQSQLFTFVWRAPTPGPHLLTAKATDNGNGSTVSAPVGIQVALPSLPLVVARAADALAVEPSSSDGTINTATFRLRRFGPTNAPLAVAYSMHGTSENSVDYDRLSGTATIPAGSYSTLVTVTPIADNLAEGIETVILRLEESAAYHLGLRRRAGAVILDTLPPPPPRDGPRVAALPDGCWHARFNAPDGFVFRVDASGDLLTWETVFTGTASDGALDFVEDETGTFPHRFYRLVPEASFAPEPQ